MALRQDDLFGLNREKKINESGVREIFTPHRPVNDVDLFFGRQDEVHSIIEQINTPGQHSLLYGERGVGKSSLANVASELLLSKLISGNLYYNRCDSESDFVSVLRRPLADTGVDISIKEVGSNSKSGGSAKLRVPFAEGGMGQESEKSETRHGPRKRLSPSYAAELLESNSGLLVIDEADSLSDDKDRHKIAEFVKQLSDRDANFKVLIVGIAQTGDELIAGHPSVRRCLRETKLKRMRSEELRLILDNGAKKLGLNFQGGVKDKIVQVSAGYPHFTHLIALKCAENAIAESLQEITGSNLNQALKEATQDAEGTLSRSYKSATRSHGTEMYRIILCAAANLGTGDFTARELREEINSLTGDSITQQSLNNYFQRLVSNDKNTVLRRLKKGVYRFRDPRMPSYVRIANKMV